MSRPLIVFDIDDTLYLERDYVRSGFESVSSYIWEKYGNPGFFDVAWRLFEQGNRGRIFNVALQELKIDERNVEVEELIKTYRTHEPQIKLLPDALEFLGRIRDDADIAFVTDGPPESQNAKAKRLGLFEYSDEIIVTAERGPEWHKPSQTSFKYLEEVFSASSENCSYYADNPQKDFYGPNALGWGSIRVRRPGGIYSTLEGLGGANRQIDNFENEYY